MCVTIQTICPACKVLLPGIQHRITYGCRPDNTRTCANGGLRLPRHLSGEALGTFECPIDGCVLSRQVVEREERAVMEARREGVMNWFSVPGAWDFDGDGGGEEGDGGSKGIEGECAFMLSPYLQPECVELYCTNIIFTITDPTSDDEVLLFTGRKGARRSKGRPTALARMVEGMAGAAVVPGLSTGSPLSRGGS